MVMERLMTWMILYSYINELFTLCRILANIEFAFSRIMSDTIQKEVSPATISYHIDEYFTWLCIDIHLDGINSLT